jgi:hypothetical protein
MRGQALLGAKCHFIIEAAGKYTIFFGKANGNQELGAGLCAQENRISS